MLNSLGIVTNCWKEQLDQGASLESLLDQAVQYGLVAIELRQTALGPFESEEGYWPDLKRLRTLAEQYPQLRFNYAMSLAFLSGEIPLASQFLDQARDAAIAVSGESVPHLRLVDLKTSSDQIAPCEDNTVQELVGLVEAMDQVGGMLSLENARQPWDDLFRIVQRTREQLGDLGEKLKICFDPANFGLSPEAGDPLQALSQMEVGELSMVHLKQVQDTVVLTELMAGEVDWQVHLGQLQQRGYQGPFLFEMAAGPDCWQRLETAQRFMQQQLAGS